MLSVCVFKNKDNSLFVLPLNDDGDGVMTYHGKLRTMQGVLRDVSFNLLMLCTTWRKVASERLSSERSK